MVVCAITMLLLSACGDDSNSSIVPTVDEKTTYIQLRMEISAGSDTRATGPKGGEDGDGREVGINHENDISNVVVLLYSTFDGSGINSTDENVTIVQALSFSTVSYNEIGDYYETEKIQVEKTLLTSGYHVIVVANSDLEASSMIGKKLSDVRDMLITKQWTEASSLAEYKKFVMTSESDAAISNPKGNGTAAEPYYIEVTIERMAARVDFDTTGGTLLEKGTFIGSYLYTVTDKDYKEGDPQYVFVLKAVEMFNCVGSGSYLIKRVGNADGSDIQYLGVETRSSEDASKDYATNYVICPYWADSYQRSFSPTLVEAQTAIASKSMSTTSGGTNRLILGYTQENTTSDNDPAESTGLLIYGTYYDVEEWDSENQEPKADAEGLNRTFTYYIRHSDPEGKYSTTATPEEKPDGVMTYGIVRNNIYIISISEVTNVVSVPILTINVRKWASYTHSAIIM